VDKERMISLSADTKTVVLYTDWTTFVNRQISTKSPDGISWNFHGG